MFSVVGFGRRGAAAGGGGASAEIKEAVRPRAATTRAARSGFTGHGWERLTCGPEKREVGLGC